MDGRIVSDSHRLCWRRVEGTQQKCRKVMTDMTVSGRRAILRCILRDEE